MIAVDVFFQCNGTHFRTSNRIDFEDITTVIPKRRKIASIGIDEAENYFGCPDDKEEKDA